MGKRKTLKGLEEEIELLENSLSEHRSATSSAKRERDNLQIEVERFKSDIQQGETIRYNLYHEKYIVMKIVLGEAEPNSKIEVLRDVIKNERFKRNALNQIF